MQNDPFKCNIVEFKISINLPNKRSYSSDNTLFHTVTVFLHTKRIQLAKIYGNVIPKKCFVIQGYQVRNISMCWSVKARELLQLYWSMGSSLGKCNTHNPICFLYKISLTERCQLLQCSSFKSRRSALTITSTEEREKSTSDVKLLYVDV